MVSTALWNIQWFNKAKFHLLLHLPFHIRRFGPALLYATETFESYNFVIRLRSIHSSKQAPSIDIAQAFSHLHAVRHLVSGGYVTSSSSKARLQAGDAVTALREDQKFLGYMLLSGLFEHKNIGRYSPSEYCRWQDSLAFKVPNIDAVFEPQDDLLRCRSLVLSNGDVLELGGYLVYQADGEKRVGLAEEILASPQHNSLVGVVVRRCSITDAKPPYHLPRCLLEMDSQGHFLTEMLSFRVSTALLWHRTAHSPVS